MSSPNKQHNRPPVPPSPKGGAPHGDKPREQRQQSPSRRESVVDRRTGLDRRLLQSANASAQSGFERRRGPGRRLSDFTRSAEEGEMTKEQFLFLKAIDAFKQANNKTYPTWSDVLEVVRLLGYRKTMAAEVELRGAEDWTEPADAPSEVKAPHRERDAA